ncbi:hypothetical protein MAR_011287 [Mya arenaria]|uniref:Uncharacterized protein n=1 Tax=Mya arenaria TaxID=6604 RepID=A0ABY7FXI7_MYAAR|nr:hypothetical protein MAR_011287 [Mya arenaria]
MANLTTKQKQGRLFKRTQNRLDRMLKLLRKVHLSKRAQPTENNELFEALVRRSLLNSMMSSGFSPGPFGLGSTASPTTVKLTTTTAEAEHEMDFNTLCTDIQGRDRACCNSAVTCFDDVRSVVDELDNAPAGSFTLSAACRRVGSELQRDRMCVQQSLSRCGGRERALLQRRFDKRVNNLYDQYNSYCRRTIQETPTTTTTIPGDTDSPRPIFPVTPTTNNTDQPRPPLPPGGGWGGHSGVGPTQGPPGDNSALTGGIIAGVITGGVILGIVLLVAVILWCRNRRDRNGSDSSTDSQGIFFQKQPSRNNNNSKPSATRQLSDPYAEIDETLVNPGYKPPVPSSMTLPDYLHPVSDDGSSNYTAPPTSGRHGSAPVITTRGQLSYGPILAANREASKGMVTPYHTTSITTNEDIQRFKDRDLSNADTLPSSRNLLANSTSETPIVNTDTFAEDVDDFGEIEGQDDYEQPVSANTSVRYAAIDHGPPKTVAPAVPTSGSSITPPTQSKHKKVGLKVLPSNPLSPILSLASPERESEMSGNDAVTSTNSTMSDVNSTASPAQPVPRPRSRKENTGSADSENAPLNINESGNVFTFKESQGIGFKELMKRTDPDAANRDSCVSDASVKSSHHYYVLEPGHNKTEYENSVSSPKMV